MSVVQHEVLVVEDDETLRESIVEYLDDHGHPAIGAVNGRDALERLESAPALPCLILLDLMTPVMDGVAFRREQRQRPRLADIPVVVVSAFNDIGARTHELDVTACLKKPLKLAEVLNIVETYCSH